MTNLLFHLVVSLVTNTSERFTYPQIPGPCPDAAAFRALQGPSVSCAVMHWQDDTSGGPSARIVTTTVCRVTNWVSSAWTGIEEINGRDSRVWSNGPNPKLIYEWGRCEIASESKTFARTVSTNWTEGFKANSNATPGIIIAPPFWYFSNGSVYQVR